jgi:hypothetical protein
MSLGMCLVKYQHQALGMEHTLQHLTIVMGIKHQFSDHLCKMETPSSAAIISLLHLQGMTNFQKRRHVLGKSIVEPAGM